MAWVRFIADFDWKPKPQVTIAYRNGMVLNVPRAAADAAIAKGKAVRMVRTHRHTKPIEANNDRENGR